MKGNKGRNTGPERRLRSVLHRRGLRFRKHHRPEPELRCEADLVFSRARVAVFIDGCFWHGCQSHGHIPRRNREYWAKKIQQNIERDRMNDHRLRERGWVVIRVWEHEALEDAAEKICAAVTNSARG
jgi:DNA mismatch endonuclease, patch repair protein